MMKTNRFAGVLAMVALAFGLLGCASQADNLVEARMKARMIPEANFREAHIWDIISFYNSCQPEDGEDPVMETILVLPSTQRDHVPQVTFEARQFSLYDSIRTMAKLTGLKFRIKDGRSWLIYEE